MRKVDSACEAIIREFSGCDTYSFEKKAEESITPKKVATAEISVRLSSVVNFRKIASEIRETALPVKVTYADVNEFIKELNNE